jgi:hypothetical protein
MANKTFKVKDERGQWMEIDPSTVKTQRVIHHELAPKTLERITVVYDMLREVIVYNGYRMSLEAFERGFMREMDPDAALDVWQAIATAYQKARGMFPPDQYTRNQIYHWLILLVMGAVSDEEKQLEEVKLIQKCFASVYPA